MQNRKGWKKLKYFEVKEKAITYWCRDWSDGGCLIVVFVSAKSWCCA
jgi:hypothetical protein